MTILYLLLKPSTQELEHWPLSYWDTVRIVRNVHIYLIIHVKRDDTIRMETILLESAHFNDIWHMRRIEWKKAGVTLHAASLLCSLLLNIISSTTSDTLCFGLSLSLYSWLSLYNVSHLRSIRHLTYFWHSLIKEVEGRSLISDEPFIDRI